MIGNRQSELWWRCLEARIKSIRKKYDKIYKISKILYMNFFCTDRSKDQVCQIVYAYSMIMETSQKNQLY